MKRDVAWEFFKKTGNIDIYLIYRQMKDGKEEKHGDDKDKRDCAETGKCG